MNETRLQVGYDDVLGEALHLGLRAEDVAEKLAKQAMKEGQKRGGGDKKSDTTMRSVPRNRPPSYAGMPTLFGSGCE